MQVQHHERVHGDARPREDQRSAFGPPPRREDRGEAQHAAGDERPRPHGGQHRSHLARDGLRRVRERREPREGRDDVGERHDAFDVRRGGDFTPQPSHEADRRRHQLAGLSSTMTASSMGSAAAASTRAMLASSSAIASTESACSGGARRAVRVPMISSACAVRMFMPDSVSASRMACLTLVWTSLPMSSGVSSFPPSARTVFTIA
ncbi:hypothetical protein ACFPRL_26970 [Pseudoclavibacter helvolus]